MGFLKKGRLLRLLNYDPETGIFTWLVSNSNRVKVGDVAGTLNNKGYVVITIDGKLHQAHRLAFLYMTGFIPKEVDHINRQTYYNAWSNLRSVSHKENMINRGMQLNNTSRFVGVCWDKANFKWVATIGLSGKTKHLGRFISKVDAISARTKAEIKYNFNNINKVGV